MSSSLSYRTLYVFLRENSFYFMNDSYLLYMNIYRIVNIITCIMGKYHLLFNKSLKPIKNLLRNISKFKNWRCVHLFLKDIKRTISIKFCVEMWLWKTEIRYMSQKMCFKFFFNEKLYKHKKHLRNTDVYLHKYVSIYEVIFYGSENV